MASRLHSPLPKHYSSSRELRNKAEKQRRDKLNYHVSELASLVPFVVRAQKKVDKTSVLRLAASYIRLHQLLRDPGNYEANFPLEALMTSETSRRLLNSIGGFLLVVTSAGKVLYVSEAIEDSFGYSQADVLGQSIYSLIHQDDKRLVQYQLKIKESPRRSFFCRLLEKSVSRNDPERYEIIHVVGQFKSLPKGSTTPDLQHVGESSKPQPLKTRIRRKTVSEGCKIEGGEEEEQGPSSECLALSLPTSPSKEVQSLSHMLVAFVQVVRDRPITELTWVESMRDEYITRHKIDAKICHVDHRISFVAGLTPREVMGHSAFQYMYPDDILWSLIAQKQMMTSSQGQGMVTYRLVCRDGSYVTLRSRGFLEVNKDTGKVDTFVCINTVISEDKAEEELKNQRKQLLPIINSQSSDEMTQWLTKDVPDELCAFIDGTALQRMISNVENVSIPKGFRGAPLNFSKLFGSSKRKDIEDTPSDPQPACSKVKMENGSSARKRSINRKDLLRKSAEEVHSRSKIQRRKDASSCRSFVAPQPECEYQSPSYSQRSDELFLNIHSTKMALPPNMSAVPGPGRAHSAVTNGNSLKEATTEWSLDGDFDLSSEDLCLSPKSFLPPIQNIPPAPQVAKLQQQAETYVEATSCQKDQFGGDVPFCDPDDIFLLSSLAQGMQPPHSQPFQLFPTR